MDLTVRSGELISVEGPSGSGKSTQLQLLGAMDTPTAGRVDFDGHPLAKASDKTLTGLRRDALGFAFQQFNLIPTLTALENIGVAMTRPRRERRARALANDPRVVLADEPTGNLDSTTAQEIIGLLVALNSDSGVTVVVVTHDDGVARRMTRRVRLRSGEVVGDEASAIT